MFYTWISNEILFCAASRGNGSWLVGRTGKRTDFIICKMKYLAFIYSKIKRFNDTNTFYSNKLTVLSSKCTHFQFVRWTKYPSCTQMYIGTILDCPTLSKWKVTKKGVKTTRHTRDFQVDLTQFPPSYCAVGESWMGPTYMHVTHLIEIALIFLYIY